MHSQHFAHGEAALAAFEVPCGLLERVLIRSDRVLLLDRQEVSDDAGSCWFLALACQVWFWGVVGEQVTGLLKPGFDGLDSDTETAPMWRSWLSVLC